MNLTLASLAPLAWLVACAPQCHEHAREVTATAYTARSAETRPHRKPGVAAWGHKLHPEARVIAVSRDLLALGLVRGTRVRIGGLDGDYEVRDKMNGRWKHRIDIFMGDDGQAAVEWGKRRVTIHWRTQCTSDSP